MKIAFFGTGDFSRNILKEIVKSKDLEVNLVVSQPDKAVGRKKKIEPTPVKAFALENNIDCLQPNKLKGNREFFIELKNLNLDFIVVVAYGKIVPNEVLESPKIACINIHGSILPSYRGASPIQESVKNGDKKTGLTIMYMSEGMDEGDILSIEEVKIEKNDKTLDIFKKFEIIGPDLLINTLKGVLSGKINGKKQDYTKATYCSKINKEDGKINWQKENSCDIYNKYRAYTPWPGIYSFFGDKKISFEDIINSQETATGFNVGSVIKKGKQVGIVCLDNKIIILKQVKLEGKRSMDILSFINGNKDFLDYKFS